MYMKYEISFSWMLTSAGFDFPKVYKRNEFIKEISRATFYFPPQYLCINSLLSLAKQTHSQYFL